MDALLGMWPLIVPAAAVIVTALVVARRRRAPGGTEHHDRLTDVPRPPEAYRLPGQSDEYRR